MYKRGFSIVINILFLAARDMISPAIDYVFFQLSGCCCSSVERTHSSPL